MKGRPVIPIDQAKGHRTNAEKRERKAAEASLLTGQDIRPYPETKASAIANKRFTEIKERLGLIGKDDALFEPVINRYCLIHGEIHQLEQTRRRISGSIRKLEKALKDKQIEFIDYMNSLTRLNDQIFKCDSLMTTKRKMLFDIERDNLMTIASALRSTTKKPAKPEADPAEQMFG